MLAIVPSFFHTSLSTAMLSAIQVIATQMYGTDLVAYRVLLNLCQLIRTVSLRNFGKVCLIFHQWRYAKSLLHRVEKALWAHVLGFANDSLNQNLSQADFEPSNPFVICHFLMAKSDEVMRHGLMVKQQSLCQQCFTFSHLSSDTRNQSWHLTSARSSVYV